MKSKTLIWLSVYAVVGYGAYYMFFSKNAFVKKILDAGMYKGGKKNLSSFDYGFLKSWSSAAKSKDPNFAYKGKVYNTQGGLAIR